MVSVVNFVYGIDMANTDDYEIPESGAVFTFGRSRFADNQPSHFFIRNDRIIDIACGDEHTALVCENGRVFVFGSNDYGQLGLGHSKPVAKPSCVKLLKPFHSVLVACGKGHTLVTTTCNQLFAFGSNSDGQLGLGDQTDRNVPNTVNLEDLGGIKVTALAAGCFHSALLTESGDAYAWGCNNDGQCGLSSSESTSLPTKITLTSPVFSISCGYYHTLIASEDGVYTMGEGDSGKLGRPDGDSQSAPQKIPFEEKVSSVKCGGSHSIVVTDSGEVYGFGSNFSGQLGVGATPVVTVPTKIEIPKTVAKVACGESHTAFATDSGELYACGDTRHGKLGLEEVNGTSLAAPTYVSALQLYEVTNVSCGGCHTMVVAKMRALGCEGESTSLPPLRVRKPAEDTTFAVEDVPTTVATEVESDQIDHDVVEPSTVVLKQEEQEIVEDSDCKSNTESSNNMEEAVTSPADDVYSEIREIQDEGKGDSELESMHQESRIDTSKQTKSKQNHSSDSAGDVVVKLPSRFQKILSVFKKQKSISTPLQSPSSEDIFISDEEKAGSQQASKACTIL